MTAPAVADLSVDAAASAERVALGGTIENTITVRNAGPATGALIDAASVSGAQFDPNYANNVAKALAHVSMRSTVARVRVVAIQPLTTPGQRVGFVITASVAGRTPGLAPVLCVALPAGLRLRSAPGATRRGSLLCWDLRELISGRAQSFRVNAVVSAGAGASLPIHAQLTGSNFAARAGAAAVSVPPTAPAACASIARPVARIAC